MSTRIVQQSKDKLIVETGDTEFIRLLLLCATACVLVALAMVLSLTRAWRTEAFQGLVCAAAFFIVILLLLYEQSVFIFDRTTDRLAWRKRRAFSMTAGEIAFQQISEVVVQTAIGTQANPKKRIALRCAEGELTLSAAYAPDPAGTAEALATTIRMIIGAGN